MRRLWSWLEGVCRGWRYEGREIGGGWGWGEGSSVWGWGWVRSINRLYTTCFGLNHLICLIVEEYSPLPGCCTFRSPRLQHAIFNLSFSTSRPIHNPICFSFIPIRENKNLDLLKNILVRPTADRTSLSPQQAPTPLPLLFTPNISSDPPPPFVSDPQFCSQGYHQLERKNKRERVKGLRIHLFISSTNNNRLNFSPWL